MIRSLPVVFALVLALTGCIADPAPAPAPAPVEPTSPDKLVDAVVDLADPVDPVDPVAVYPPIQRSRAGFYYGESNTFEFELDSPMTVRVRTQGSDGGDCPGDTVLSVAGANYSGENDDAGDNGLCSLLEFEGAVGRYIVEVYGYCDQAVPDYQLEVEFEVVWGSAPEVVQSADGWSEEYCDGEEDWEEEEYEEEEVCEEICNAEGECEYYDTDGGGCV